MDIDFNIRPANSEDATAVNDIANWYIEHTATNFDTEPWSIEKRRQWIDDFNHAKTPYHLLVGESDGVVIGFACNTPFRPKAAYNSSTETTVYIAHGIKSLGRGRMLYQRLLDLVVNEKFHRAYAVITLPNSASISLHQYFGYTLVGTFDQIGKKFGRYHSVAMYQKEIC